MVGRKRKRGRRKNTEYMQEGQLLGRGLHKETVELIQYINANILQNQPKSIRRIYYALEAQQKIESSPKSYQKIVNTVKMARFHGLIHPDLLLVDRKRQTRTHITNTYFTHEIFKTLQYAAYAYKVNFWNHSEDYIEIWQEKGTVEPEFHKICQKYNIRLETGGGDQSIQIIWQSMKRWNLFLSRHKRIVILYFGDFNPSGLHALTAIQNTVSKLASAWKHEFTSDFSQIEFKRIGLSVEHIEKHHLPENPTKQTTHKDKVIAERFIRKYGDRNVEIDSLAERNPEALNQMIEDAINEYVDENTKVKAKEKENKVRPRIEKIITKMMKNYFEKEEN